MSFQSVLGVGPFLCCTSYAFLHFFSPVKRILWGQRMNGWKYIIMLIAVVVITVIIVVVTEMVMMQLIYKGRNALKVPDDRLF